MQEARRELGKLEKRFPAFEFDLIRGYHGRQWFEAVRKSGPGDPGLYALIGESPAEVADELKRAA